MSLLSIYLLMLYVLFCLGCEVGCSLCLVHLTVACDFEFSPLRISVLASGVVQIHAGVQNLHPALVSLLQHWFKSLNFTQIWKLILKHVFCYLVIWLHGQKSINMYICNVLPLFLKIQGADIMKVPMQLPKVALLEKWGNRLNNQNFLLLNNQVLNTEFQCEAVRASQILLSLRWLKLSL